MKQVIAFDFDGVLVDPLQEAVPAAVKTFNEMNGTNHKTEFFMEKFRKMTGLIRTGKDVMPVLHSIEKGKTGISRKELNEYKNKLGKEKVLWLEEEYYKRKKENRKNEEKWLSSLKPHEKAIEAFEKAGKRFETWIVTTRDIESIQKFFKNRGMELDAGKMIDKSTSHDKRKQFSVLKEKSGAEFKEMVFFEDTIYNAFAVHSLGVNVFLSTWGFSKQGQWKEAEKAGIKPIRQEEMLECIEKATGVKI